MPLFLDFITTILAISQVQGTSARRSGFRHEAVDASKQDPIKRSDYPLANSSSSICAATNLSRTVYSTVYPSPGASPIEITSQSQIITSFIPEMTWCVGPPIGLMPVSTAPYANHSTDYATVTAGTGHCETVYVPTTTTVCATTLTGIASKVTVSECDQEVTFSSECGFTLETPTPTTPAPLIYNHSLVTPAPTVRTMMTYWIAPWQSLTAGDTPSDVDTKICKILHNGEMECTRYKEVWEVVIVTNTVTSTHDVQLTTTINGPGTLIVETMQIHVTDTIETVDLSTTLVLESDIETESTSKSRQLVKPSENTLGAPTSTLYVTKHLKHKTSQPEPTTTIRVTSVITQFLGTITRTRARPLPTLAEMREF